MRVWDSNQGADTCVRAMLYMIAKMLQDDFTDDDIVEYMEVKEFCRLNKWTGHRKSSRHMQGNDHFIKAYTWARTEDIRKTLQKFIPWTMYAGLNGDQYRAYFLVLAHEKDVIGALKVMFGFCYRALPVFGLLTLIFGLMWWAPIVAILLSPFPSFMEFVITKPHAFLMLFKVHWIFKPLYYLVYPLWLFSKWRNLNQTIAQGTTNKISLLIQLKMLGHKLPGAWYIIKVYRTYFVPGSENALVGEECIKALT